MKEKINNLINLISSKEYDKMDAHILYDELLETFVLNYDPELLPLMKKLIELDKSFWYA